jgi:glycosyltransferase involved in cell wall biosynthesis
MLTKEAEKAPLTFRHAVCVSAAVRDILVKAGIPVANAKIIYTGLDVKKYLNSKHIQRGYGDRNLNLLYAGRLTPDKGIETAIEAMTKVVFSQGKREIKLTLVGSGSAEYENHLRQLVNQAGLTDNVSFLGWVPPAEMPELLQKFDVLVLPSIWPEPFSRAVLEGMISGLVVVATRTGGTPEIIADGENGLLFMPNDPEDLAKKIARLADHPESRGKLAEAGKQTVLERFTITIMMDEVESFLQDVADVSNAKKSIQYEPIRNPV